MRKEKLLNYIRSLSPSVHGSIDSREEKSNESLPRIVDPRKQFDNSLSPPKARNNFSKTSNKKPTKSDQKRAKRATKIKIPTDDRNKFIVRDGLAEKIYDKFSLKYEDLTHSGVDPQIFDPNATTNNILNYLNTDNSKPNNDMTRDRSSSVEHEKTNSKAQFDPLKPIKGKLMKLLQDDIKKETDEYHKNIRKQTYKKIRAQKDHHSVSIVSKNLARRKIQQNRDAA